ncbi:MBL fold metallo-hydrolase [Actinocatenispora rupis]|uniref:MBL fold metallo-hydrolase n=1 Tax=Actinocatenispora rupis TaxID=519421 RepID=A0A8J3IXK0_9ACTN|nr:MBL fold metallo-hydrolase [Actinocatenispora rupis]GID10508.1 MBL fold metallo-hydrolase [Actinocatenispora rupis]
MRLIRYAHACVRLESAAGVLVFDPSGFAGPEALTGADVVLVSHGHFDHVDPDLLRTAGAGLRVWAPAPVVAELPDLGGRASVVGPGETFDAAGYRVRTYGGTHARVHPHLLPDPAVPFVPNVGYLVDGVYHPGDALVAPDAPVRTLLLPVSGPWLKVAEAVDFARAVGAERTVPIHDAINSELGNQVVDRTLRALLPDTDYRRLAPGESIEL